jgi:hypothetical protein
MEFFLFLCYIRCSVFISNWVNDVTTAGCSLGIIFMEAGYHSRRSDWLRVGRPRSCSSSPGRVKNVLFSTSSKPVMGPIQLPTQRYLGAFSLGVKQPGHEPELSQLVPRTKKLDQSINSSIRLHGVVLNSFDFCSYNCLIIFTIPKNNTGRGERWETNAQDWSCRYV